jgi:hypothetical protein
MSFGSLNLPGREWTEGYMKAIEDLQKIIDFNARASKKYNDEKIERMSENSAIESKQI